MRDEIERLKQAALNLEKRAEARFDTAPGAYVTGGSGRRKSGLHRRTSRAIEGSLSDLRKAKRFRERAARLEERTPERQAERQAAHEARHRAAREVAKAESARRKAAPILNRPRGLSLTSAQWKRIPKDYKGLAVIEIAGCSFRIRRALRGGALQEIFLSDKTIRDEG